METPQGEPQGERKSPSCTSRGRPACLERRLQPEMGVPPWELPLNPSHLGQNMGSQPLLPPSGGLASGPGCSCQGFWRRHSFGWLDSLFKLSEVPLGLPLVCGDDRSAVTSLPAGAQPTASGRLGAQVQVPLLCSAQTARLGEACPL